MAQCAPNEEESPPCILAAFQWKLWENPEQHPVLRMADVSDEVFLVDSGKVIWIMGTGPGKGESGLCVGTVLIWRTFEGLLWRLRNNGTA